ncbi:unnamed protein product, partial [Prorocentrum cordatum]
IIGSTTSSNNIIISFAHMSPRSAGGPAGLLRGEGAPPRGRRRVGEAEGALRGRGERLAGRPRGGRPQPRPGRPRGGGPGRAAGGGALAADGEGPEPSAGGDAGRPGRARGGGTPRGLPRRRRAPVRAPVQRAVPGRRRVEERPRAGPPRAGAAAAR